MKYASDFRTIARDALKGRWLTAVLAGLIATLLGGISSGGPELKVTFENSNINIGVNYGRKEIYSLTDGFMSNPIVIAGITYTMLLIFIMAIALIILGSVVEVGYMKFNLDLIDGQKEVEINTLFHYFSYWKTTTAARLLQGLYIFLWSLLLIIPGILATYNYKMTGYILAEHPEMTASEAITRSKELMYGNRWRLFCLEISFIGWAVLCAFTFGIGGLWLTPYTNTSKAAFYREISGTECIENNEI